MSISDEVTFQCGSASKTSNLAYSLAMSLYRPGVTILLSGELGAGKTTFTQGLARGLGLTETVTSPSYALEQRYGDGKLTHIDLYRLSGKQAEEFLRSQEETTGVRVIEWPERATLPDAGMLIRIDEAGSGRNIHITCNDIRIPTDAEIEAWIQEVKLPKHIVRHMHTVADAASKVANDLQKQGRFIRPNALRAAALTHDLLRFTDFRSLTGDEHYTPTPEESAVWQKLKDQYGTPHEGAASRWLSEHGYPEIGVIVAAHRGLSTDGKKLAVTIEEMALAYADKRAAFDRPVTLDERFNDFLKRYGDGKTESPYAKAWRDEMKRIERELFPDGAPF